MYCSGPLQIVNCATVKAEHGPKDALWPTMVAGYKDRNPLFEHQVASKKIFNKGKLCGNTCKVAIIWFENKLNNPQPKMAIYCPQGSGTLHQQCKVYCILHCIEQYLVQCIV